VSTATRAGSAKASIRFADPSVGAVFKAYPPALRSRLIALRQIIFETAQTTEGVGELQEALKWGQPSYLTLATKSGSTIRIDRIKSRDDQYAIYFHCQTDLVETFRELYPKQLTFAGNRCIVLNVADTLPEPALRHCIGLALTYHLRKAQARRS
jgi:hypothetical protein